MPMLVNWTQPPRGGLMDAPCLQREGKPRESCILGRCTAGSCLCCTSLSRLGPADSQPNSSPDMASIVAQRWFSEGMRWRSTENWTAQLWRLPERPRQRGTRTIPCVPCSPQWGPARALRRLIGHCCTRPLPAAGAARWDHERQHREERAAKAWVKRRWQMAVLRDDAWREEMGALAEREAEGLQLSEGPGWHEVTGSLTGYRVKVTNLHS